MRYIYLKIKTIDKIIEIIDNNIKDCEKKKKIREKGELKNINIDSIIFIKIIVEIENEYNIEFEDEFLNYNQFDTLLNLSQYVEYLINKNQ